MTRGPAALILLLALAGCRTYDYSTRIVESDGFVPGDQMARYGHEQAEAVAIARRFAAADEGSSPAALVAQADSAMAYAKTLPGVANTVADPESHRLTVQFKSGWRVGVVPLADGKAAAETPGLSAAARR